jgi:hypothetical protein
MKSVFRHMKRSIESIIDRKKYQKTRGGRENLAQNWFQGASPRKWWT